MKERIRKKKKKIPTEPDENNSNSTLIALRFPHTGNLIKRRFLKTEKIQVKYKMFTYN